MALKDAIDSGRDGAGSAPSARRTPVVTPAGGSGIRRRPAAARSWTTPSTSPIVLRWLLHDEFERVQAEIGSFLRPAGRRHRDPAARPRGRRVRDHRLQLVATEDLPDLGRLTLHVVGEHATIDVDVFRQALTHYDDRGIRDAARAVGRRPQPADGRGIRRRHPRGPPRPDHRRGRPACARGRDRGVSLRGGAAARRDRRPLATDPVVRAGRSRSYGGCGGRLVATRRSRRSRP